MKKIVAFSDTHDRHKGLTLPKGDIAIHAGDATGRGEYEETLAFLKWFGAQNFEHKIFTPGNHDFIFEKNPTLAKQLAEENSVTLLNHETIVIDGIKIFASPWTPYFYNWAFNAGRTIPEAAHFKKPFIGDLWQDIPADTNILVTHGPPYDVLDELLFIDGRSKGQFVGCVELRKKIEEIKPDIHIFGHIHCQHGQKHINGTSYYNVAVCDEMYGATQPVTVIDYE